MPHWIPSVDEANPFVVVQTHTPLKDRDSTTTLTDITDVTIDDSEPDDDISDVSMDEVIRETAAMHTDLSMASSDSHVESDCSSLNPRVIFSRVIHNPKYSSTHNTTTDAAVVTTIQIQSPSCPHYSLQRRSIDWCDETRWNTYQHVQDVDDGPNKVPLTCYEQAIQFYELGLTTIPRSGSLKDPANPVDSIIPPLLFMGGLHSHHDAQPDTSFRKRSLSESSYYSANPSHNNPRRCIFPTSSRDRCDSYGISSSCSKSIQSYQYSSKPLFISPWVGSSSSPALGTISSKRKLKSCIKNKSGSEGELSLTLQTCSKGRIITPSTSNEKDLSVSFDPHVSIYDLGNRGNIKWTQPGWSNMFI